MGNLIIVCPGYFAKMAIVCFDRPATTWINFEKELHSVCSALLLQKMMNERDGNKMIAVSQDLLFLKIKENKCFDTCIKKALPFFQLSYLLGL